MAQYKLEVTTGDLKDSGTMDYVFATLFGTEGQSERTELNKLGFDLLIGMTRTYTMKTVSSLGKILLLKLEKDPFLLPSEDQWYCSKIVVMTPEGEELLFPCYRWIKRGQPMELRGGKAVKEYEEEHQLLSEHRKQELIGRKNLFQWEVVDENIPHKINYNDIADLPAEVQYSFSRETDYQFKRQLLGVELTFKGLVGSEETWGSIDDMKKIFSFKKSDLSEYVADHWMEDEFFGYQFLNGNNPTEIKRCSKLPPNFPVTDEMVNSFLQNGSSLEKEMEKGNIFICDQKIMEGITTRIYNGEALKINSGFCLFYMNPQKKLMPIAIQLQQQPSDQNPIFLPSDPETDWLLAKIYVKSVDALGFEELRHLLATHFFAEVFSVATLRCFPAIHPLNKLLTPHFRFTLHINTLGRKILFAKEGALNTSTLGYDGTTELMRRGLSEMTYNTLCLPENIAERGLESVPDFYYRDDGLKHWNIINSFVKKVVEYYYSSDADVVRDSELQDWIQEIFTHGFLGNKASGIPSQFNTVGELVKFITMVIFTVSVQHAALNNGQFDYLSWAPNGPMLLRKPPPTTKGEATMKTVLDTLPNIGETVTFAAVAVVLSEKYSDRVLLGNYPEERFDEPAVKQMIKEFQGDLSTLGDIIEARNSELPIKYTYQHPKQIENSVTI